MEPARMSSRYSNPATLAFLLSEVMSSLPSNYDE
jgi:hypothetical protein